MESARDRVLAILDSIPADDSAPIHLPYVADHSRVATLYANERGLITWVNRSAREMFGYSFEQMRDQPIIMVVPARFRAAHEAAFSRRVGEELGEHVANVKVRDMTLHSFALHADGTEFPVIIRLTGYRHNGSITFAASVEMRYDPAEQGP